MGNMRFKTLDMSNDIDRKILLTYFFKKQDTVLDTNELLTMSCICYDSKKENLYSQTKRFSNELTPYKDKKVLKENVDDTLKKVLCDCLRIQEEIVRCDFPLDNSIDHFYIAVIGVDFFLTETELRK
jgi:hypothetical protein